MYCKNCGKELIDGMTSCPFCNTQTVEKLKTNNKNSKNTIGYMTGLVIIIALVIGFIAELKIIGLDESSTILFNKDNNSNLYNSSSSFSYLSNNVSSFYHSSNNNNSFSYSNKVYNIGEKIITNKLEITVTNVEQKSTVGTMYLTESAGEGNTYVCFRIKIKNISNEPIDIFSQPSFTLVDEKNIIYNVDIAASSFYSAEIDNTSKVISDLNPGVTVYDSCVFQLGKDYYAQNAFCLKIEADKDITVNFK